jgi:hypothetical protein
LPGDERLEFLEFTLEDYYFEIDFQVDDEWLEASGETEWKAPRFKIKLLYCCGISSCEHDRMN